MDQNKAVNGRQRVELDPLKISMIYETFPKWKKGREVSRVIDDLMSDYLDKNYKLIMERGERERAIHTSNNKKNKEKQKKEFSTEEVNESFNTFWTIYRSASKGVSNAKKTKALEEFKKAVSERNAKPPSLIEAATKAVNDQKMQLQATGDCLCLPDAFRWLRDDIWLSLLEAVTVKQQVQQAGIQIYD